MITLSCQSFNSDISGSNHISHTWILKQRKTFYPIPGVLQSLETVSGLGPGWCCFHSPPPAAPKLANVASWAGERKAEGWEEQHDSLTGTVITCFELDNESSVSTFRGFLPRRTARDFHHQGMGTWNSGSLAMFTASGNLLVPFQLLSAEVLSPFPLWAGHIWFTETPVRQGFHSFLEERLKSTSVDCHHVTLYISHLRTRFYSQNSGNFKVLNGSGEIFFPWCEMERETFPKPEGSLKKSVCPGFLL